MLLDLEDEFVGALEVGLGVDHTDIPESGGIDHASVGLRQRHAEAEEAKNGEEDDLKGVHVSVWS